MEIKQVSVFIQNTEGRLAEITKTISAAGINIRALSLADSADFGVLRLIVDNHTHCLAVLKEAGFMAQETSVIAVEIEDHPGGLDRVLATFATAGINVEYMYAFVEKTRDNAVVIFRIDGMEQAFAALKTAGIPVVSDDILRNM